VVRGVYTIESLEQMLQKKFQGGRFDVEPGGNVAATDIIDTFAQCSSKLQNMLGVHCVLSACITIDIDRHTVESETMLKVVPCIIYTLH